MRASVRSLDGLLQICYDTSHRVHTSKAYPLQAPNGSKIILYGHEQGLRCVWKGGRAFKNGSEPTGAKATANGTTSDAIMLDSSDDEAAQDESRLDNSAFQDDEDERHSSELYEPIIQTLDLPLGVEVLHLAFPHLPADLQPSSLASLPSLLSQNMVIAVACSDFLIRVISLPLTPPSPQSKMRPQLRGKLNTMSAAKSVFGEHVVVLSSGTTHQSIPWGVSVSLTARRPDDVEDADMEDDEGSFRAEASVRDASRSRSRSRLGEDQTWELLVASHSADLSGLLLIHRVPLVAEGTSISTELHVPWRKQYLVSPAMSVEFSSGLYPAPRHSQLLVAEENGTVRILDCLPSSKAMQGTWLLSLYTEFETLQDSTSRRKPILGAQWILGGKAILALLLDGKWGIWDHEGCGPKPTDRAHADQGKASKGPASFAIHGWVGDSSKSKTLPRNPTEYRSKLAPMTPSTRKLKQDALFAGPTSGPDGPARGGLFVVPIHDPSTGRADDDFVLIWHGSDILTIPSILTHWQNKIRGSGNLFGTGAKGEPKYINNIQLGGEFCNEVSLIPNHYRTGSLSSSSNNNNNNNNNNNKANQLEILVTGEKRIIIVAPPLPEPEAIPATTPSPRTKTADQSLLARGELDVNGMDRLLSGMSNGHTQRRKPQAPTTSVSVNNLLQ